MTIFTKYMTTERNVTAIKAMMYATRLSNMTQSYQSYRRSREKKKLLYLSLGVQSTNYHESSVLIRHTSAAEVSLAE